MNETQQQEHWNRWLKRYWQDRLDGVPKPLESDEIKRMMDWLPHLKGVFPEAVELAIQMPQSEAGGKRASLAIYDLERSYLLELHPEATAKLVLYIRPSLPPTDLAYGHQKQTQRELIHRLLPVAAAARTQDEAPRTRRPINELTLRSFCPQLSHPCNLSATLQHLLSPASPLSRRLARFLLIADTTLPAIPFG